MAVYQWHFIFSYTWAWPKSFVTNYILLLTYLFYISHHFNAFSVSSLDSSIPEVSISSDPTSWMSVMGLIYGLDQAHILLPICLIQCMQHPSRVVQDSNLIKHHRPGTAPGWNPTPVSAVGGTAWDLAQQVPPVAYIPGTVHGADPEQHVGQQSSLGGQIVRLHGLYLVCLTPLTSTDLK